MAPIYDVAVGLSMTLKLAVQLFLYSVCSALFLAVQLCEVCTRSPYRVKSVSIIALSGSYRSRPEARNRHTYESE
jgi:hypothetical protein